MIIGILIKIIIVLAFFSGTFLLLYLGKFIGVKGFPSWTLSIAIILGAVFSQVAWMWETR
jgi:membrane protein DedA with SNARE-associated domain